MIGFGEGLRGETLERLIHPWQSGITFPVGPAGEAVGDRSGATLQSLGERASSDESARVDDADRVPERFARKVGIEESHCDAHPREAQPDRQVVRAVLKQQADDIARLEPLRQRPAGVAVGLLRKLAVAQGCLG